MAIEQKFQPVHINYLTANPGVRLLSEMIRNMSDYLGINKHDLIAAIRGETQNNPFQTGKLINDKFHFGSERQSMQHFISAEKTARDVIDSVSKIYGLPSGRFGQKTEIEIPDPKIERMLLYTNPKGNEILPKGTILKTRFEQLREIMLIDIALRLDKRALDEESYDKMSELQLIFNQQLFDGPAGSEETIKKYVSFNDEHGIEKISKTNFKGANKIEETMRTIEIGGEKKICVIVNFNKKPAKRQILKGLVEYLRINAKEYDPIGLGTDGRPSLQDRQRFMFVVDGDDNDISATHGKISTFFNNVEEVPIHQNKKDQNPTLRKRYIAFYKEIPMEIIYYDFRGYKNSQGHIGNKNEIGLYNGSAHELFEIRRSLPILQYFFPFEVYGKNNQSRKEYNTELMDFARNKSEEVAIKIRGC